MRISLLDIWGCGRGPARKASSQIRLVAGAIVFFACLISSTATLAGSLHVGLVCAFWLVMCRPPQRLLRAFFLLGLVMFLPYFLLAPLLSATYQDWKGALMVPWSILAHGFSAGFICLATVATLSVSDLREALFRLPLPNIMSAILMQVIHQTATLFHETGRMADAMAVRGASSRGIAVWRVLFSLPRVWLPRVMIRAERVGAAMELRGYGDHHTRPDNAGVFGIHDVATLGAAGMAFGAALIIRLMERL